MLSFIFFSTLCGRTIFFFQEKFLSHSWCRPWSTVPIINVIKVNTVPIINEDNSEKIGPYTAFWSFSTAACYDVAEEETTMRNDKFRLNSSR